jgi:cyclohexanecarboxyl-CoA dehydrogenase
MLSFEFTEEQDQFRKTMRDFAQARLLPGYSRRAMREEYPWSEHKALGDMGVLGIGLPPEYGGTGEPDYISLGIACEELAYGDVTLSAAPTQVGLIADLIAQHGTDAAKERYLARMISGELMVALALTEPEAGSDAAALRTSAQRTDGGWLLNGEKTSITLVQHAESSIVFARQPGTTRSNGISAFIVDFDQPGVTIGDFHDMGLIPIGRGTISLENAFVPDDNLLGNEGSGFRLVMSNFDFSRATIGLQCLGAARASLEEATQYMKERKTFGKPLAAYQGLSFQVAEHYTYLEAARLLCYWTLWLRQTGRPHTAQAAMCKWWAPRVAQHAIESALLIHGHSGWSDEMPHQARLRDVMAFLIADGTAEIQKLIIGREYIGREVQG